MEHQGTPVVTTHGPGETKTPTTRQPGSGGGLTVWLVGGVCALGVIGGAYYYLTNGGHKASASDSRHSAGGRGGSEGLSVEVAHPKAGGVERTTTQAGSVHPFDYASLYAKVSGYLKSQSVDIGDRVKQGQLLAVIDDPEVDKAVEQSKAALEQSKALVLVAEAKIRSAEAAKAAAEAMVKVSEASVVAKVSNQELQNKQLTRIRGLVARGAVEDKLQDEQKDRYDVATADAGVARAEVISAQATVANKAALVEEARASLVEARADVEAAKADLEKAKVLQEYTRITSPYDGVVTLRSFHRGDFIRSATEGGATPVLAVARTDTMRVILPIPDTEVPYVDKGDKVVFQIVALPGRTFTGTISRFSETEDPESRNMRTEVDLPNPDGTLHEGMYGRVTVILNAASTKGVTIPSSGMIAQTGKGEGSVYVVRGGKAEKIDVKVGNDNGVETEILSGLTTEDLVITSYNGPIADGTPVVPVTKTAARSTPATSH